MKSRLRRGNGPAIRSENHFPETGIQVNPCNSASERGLSISKGANVCGAVDLRDLLGAQRAGHAASFSVPVEGDESWMIRKNPQPQAHRSGACEPERRYHFLADLVRYRSGLSRSLTTGVDESFEGSNARNCERTSFRAPSIGIGGSSYGNSW